MTKIQNSQFYVCKCVTFCFEPVIIFIMKSVFLLYFYRILFSHFNSLTFGNSRFLTKIISYV